MNKPELKRKMANGALFIVLTAALCWLSATHAATVYVWRDDSGTRQYSDHCPTGEKCRVKRIGSTDDSSGPKGKAKGHKNTTTTDSGGTDTGTTDTGTTGTGTSDSGTTDTGTVDSGTTDTDVADSGTAEPDTTETDISDGGTSTNPVGDTTADTGDTTTAGDSTNDTPVDTTATLEWDPVDDPDLWGYRVYHAPQDGIYPPRGSGIYVGNSSTYILTGLESGTRYSFRVTAVDSSGNESDYSNEAFKDIP